MPENDHTEYELGRDVTPLAAGGRKKDTAVVSVRLPVSDIARLEGIGRENGKTVSQIVRDAVAAYRVHRPTMVVAVDGVKVSTGHPQSISRNARCEVIKPVSSRNSTGTRVSAYQTG